MSNSHNLSNALTGSADTFFEISWELGTEFFASLPVEQQSPAIAHLLKANISDFYRIYLFSKLKTPEVLPYLISALKQYPQIAVKGMRLQNYTKTIPHLLDAADKMEVINLLGESGAVCAIKTICQTIKEADSDLQAVGIDALIEIGRQSLERYRQGRSYPSDRHQMEVQMLLKQYQSSQSREDIGSLSIIASALYDLDRKQAIACIRETEKLNKNVLPFPLSLLLYQAGSYPRNGTITFEMNPIVCYCSWLWNKIKHLWQKPDYPSAMIGIIAAILNGLCDALSMIQEIDQRRKISQAVKDLGGEKFHHYLCNQHRGKFGIPIYGYPVRTEEQIAALQILGLLKDVESISMFGSKLTTDHEEIYAVAIGALTEVGSNHSINVAVDALSRQHNSQFLMSALAQFEQSIDRAENIPILIHLLITGKANYYAQVPQLRSEIQGLQAKFAPTPASLEDAKLDPMIAAFAEVHPLEYLTFTIACLFGFQSSQMYLETMQGEQGQQLKALVAEVSRISNQYHIGVKDLASIVQSAQYDTYDDYLNATKAQIAKLYANSEDEKSAMELSINLEIRKVAAKVLARLQTTKAIPALRSILAEQHDFTEFAELRRIAANAVIKLGQFNQDYLEQLLSDHDEDVRLAVLDAIAERRDTSAIPILISMVSDYLHPQRPKAAETLLAIGGDLASQAFIQIAQGSTEKMVHIGAINYLAATRTKLAGSFIANYVQSHPEYRDLIYIIKDLGFTGESALIPLLKPYLAKGFSQAVAIAALVRLGDEEAFNLAITELTTPMPPLPYGDQQMRLKGRRDMAEAIAGDDVFLTVGFAKVQQVVAQTDNLEIFQILQTALNKFKQT